MNVFDDFEKEFYANVNNNNNTCDPYVQGEYGCFDSENLTPNQIIKNDDPNKMPFTSNWSSWQNYYVAQKEESKSLSDADISNWGRVVDNNPPECSFITSSVGLVQPYGENLDCGTECNIMQANTLNNQGNIIGGVTLSNSASCLFSDSGSNNMLGNVTDSDGRLNKRFVNYMGSENCNIIGTQVLSCPEESELCLGENGDNCLNCETLPERNHTCCLDPADNLEYPESNLNILNVVGNKVSYICQGNGSPDDMCPNGSSDINKLRNSACGYKNCDTRNKTECDSCKYCVWSEGTGGSESGACYSKCPGAPLYGWKTGNGSDGSDGSDGSNVTMPPGTSSPTTTGPIYVTRPPTNAPTVSPSPSPVPGSIGNVSRNITNNQKAQVGVETVNVGVNTGMLIANIILAIL